MITKINKIKDFGVFRDFKGDTLPEFKTFNLIYGWNYSGKTTISRVFRCLEQGKIHKDYSNSTFELEDNNGTKYDQKFGAKVLVRVFNSDFIKENFKWDDDNIEPFFLLGEKNIELQNNIDLQQRVLAKHEEELKESNILLKATNDKLGQTLTDKAREISELLGLVRKFNRDNLVQMIVSEKNVLEQMILSDTDFRNYKSQADSNEVKPVIEKLTLSQGELLRFKHEVEDILLKQVSSTRKIEKLLNNKELSDWVEKGKDIHKDNTSCEFCGNTLPADIFTRLNAHFSKEYEVLKTAIRKKIDFLNKNKIVISLPNELAFYQNLNSEYSTFKTTLENEIIIYNAAIDSLVHDLEVKRDSPFDLVLLTEFTDNHEQFEVAIKGANEVIAQNNERTHNFTSAKNKAIEKLKRHYVARFEREVGYFTIQDQIALLSDEINKKNQIIRNTKEVIKNLKNQLDEAEIAAKKVNEYLQIFFGKDDVQIVTTPDKKFKLMRRDRVAKNLSEGEKTAISFAYFITKLAERGSKISDSIVYIDDPVSSLDANHLFNIYSFIKNVFYEYTKDYSDNSGKPKHLIKCKQLFISTHNFDFHNLLHDWIKEKSIGKDKQAYFIIERSRNEEKDESVLKVNSKLLTIFNSEYAYLFSLIHKFHHNPNENEDFLYNLPNILRKFVETFLNFKYLTPSKIEESINKLIENPIDCERARKFMHYYSHSLTTDSFLRFTDLAECQDVVGIILNSVRNIDPTHFSALIETVTKMD